MFSKLYEQANIWLIKLNLIKGTAELDVGKKTQAQSSLKLVEIEQAATKRYGQPIKILVET